jgi:glycerol-3-phosphate dehydrogenase (NAD(P)+)
MFSKRRAKINMETTISQFGIIGAGELGSALGVALTKAGEQVLYYDREPTKTTTASIEDLVHSCPVLILCIPSWETKTVAKQIEKAARPGEQHLVITLSKGVERGFVTMDALLREMLPDYFDIGVLYGPMIADEIVRGRHGSGVLAVSNTKWYQPLRDTFAAAGISVGASGDVRGVSVCAVLKNIYAIAFGLSEGMHLGLNSKGKLAVMALQEMKMILTDMKADPHTAEGVAGLGDMLATGFSENSFNYRVGKSLAEGIADEHIRSEGLVALDELSHAVDLGKYPVANTVSQIVFHYGEPAKLGELIARA